jgi:hypothetical protein
MQRQQVRATVWPILEFQSSNTPDIHVSLANKGVGPAIVRHVVDGQPVSNWTRETTRARISSPSCSWRSPSSPAGFPLAAPAASIR